MQMGCNNCGNVWESKYKKPPKKCAKCKSDKIGIIEESGNPKSFVEFIKEFQLG